MRTFKIFFFFVVDLVGLLRWKAKKHEIPTVLTSLLKIDGEEIVKVNSMRLCTIFSENNLDFTKRTLVLSDNSV